MRYTQFLFFVLLNLSAQFGLIIPALAAENISLDEATTLALQANPDIAVAISGREVESGQALQAGARPVSYTHLYCRTRHWWTLH